MYTGRLDWVFAPSMCVNQHEMVIDSFIEVVYIMPYDARLTNQSLSDTLYMQGSLARGLLTY